MLIEMMQPTRTLLHVTIQSIDTSGTVVWMVVIFAFYLHGFNLDWISSCLRPKLDPHKFFNCQMTT